jgi:hypothetical protein
MQLCAASATVLLWQHTGPFTKSRPAGSNLLALKESAVRRLVVLGLLIKVYWGGYGPWPTIDFPVLVTFRTFAEPLLLYGGAALYIFGWVANFI